MALGQLASAAELVLELFDAAGGIDEALLTGEGGVRVGSDVADNDLVIHTVNGFGLAAAHSRAGQELVTSGDIDECDGIELRMEISFHGDRPSNKVECGLALTRFEARVRLADYIDATLTTNDLAVRVTIFERFE